MWSVAPLSMIQSCGDISVGIIRFDEKTEWSKLIEVCKQREVTLSNSLSSITETKPAVLKEPEG